MKFNNGLITDVNKTDQPPNSYRAAKNVIITDSKYNPRPENGFNLYATLSDDYLYCGSIPLPDGRVIIFNYNTVTLSSYIHILELDKSLTVLVNSVNLGFTQEFKVNGFYGYNNKSNVIIVFWADNIPPRLLNIDVPIISTTPNSTDLEKTLLFSKIKSPETTFTIANGGTLKSGTYYFAYNYIDEEDFETNYTKIAGPVYITDGNENSVEGIDGAPAGSATNKSISLSVTNIDTKYKFLQLVVIKKIEGVIEPFIVKKLNINNDSTKFITYNGAESEISISLEELLTPTSYYKRIKTGTLYYNIPYFANLEVEPEINWQSVANNIIINYTTKLIDATTLLDSHNLNSKKGFAHGGVYAYYMQVEYTNGTFSKQYHIPGRPSILGDTGGASNTVGLTALTYQLLDTTNKNSQTYSGANGALEPNELNVSNMGYWENKGETYDASFPTLNGQKVRHHVFPTIAKCKELHYSGEPAYGVTKLDVLGIIASNIIIPNEHKSKVKNVRILYAKRDLSKSNVIAQDILLYSASGESDSNLRWSTGGNWSLDAEKAGGTWNNLTLEKDYVRSHAFDLMLTKPTLSPTHISLELKLTKTKLNLGVAANGKEGGYISTTGNNRGQIACLLVDYTDTENTASAIVTGEQQRKVNSFKYLTNNVKLNNLSNIAIEECAYLEMDSPTGIGVGVIPLLTDTIYTQDLDTGANRPPDTPETNESILGIGREETYLYTIKQIVDDVYLSYKDQELAVTDSVSADSNATEIKNIYNGDVFVSIHGFITAGPLHEDSVDEYEKGIRIIRAHVCETANNANLKHVIDSDIYTSHYPKLPALSWISNPNTNNSKFLYDASGAFNTIGYNNDYTSINTLVTPNIADVNVEDVYTFPYRIIRGNSGNLSTFENSWRKFLVADYYEKNSDKGEIVNIQTYNDRLIIHYKYSMFITVGKDRLLTNATEVTLGTGDIFGQEPNIIQDDPLGIAGTQNRHACKLTPLGYVSVDCQMGHIHILTDRLQRISNIDISREIREVIIKVTKDTPLIKEGISFEYDEEYNRLLFTFMWKEGELYKYKTYSYTNEMKEGGAWVCTHDYSPIDYIRLRDKLLLVKESVGSSIYQHNILNKYCIYFDQNVINDFSIEFVFNQASEVKKFFASLLINSEITTINGTVIKKPISTIRVVTRSGLDTGVITLQEFQSLLNKGNTRHTNKGWTFNKLFATYNEIQNKQYFIDYYLSVTLTFNNAKNVDNSQNLLYLYNVDAFIKPTTR